jgi:hypothetical protein
MVAGVQAGRISAVVFISFCSFGYGQPTRLPVFEMATLARRFKIAPGKDM